MMCNKGFLKTDKQKTNIATVIPTIKDNDSFYLIVEGENFRLDFKKEDGFLCRYDANGMSMLKEDGKLTPNFFRAPTDNDITAKRQKEKYTTWHNPELNLTSLTHKTENGLAIVNAEYDMPSVKAKLYLTYQINNEGAIKVSQKMETDKSAKIMDMYRFGMQIQMPKNYYPEDNCENKPLLTWRSHANNFYTNWINYYVYQTTPYILEDDE